MMMFLSDFGSLYDVSSSGGGGYALLIIAPGAYEEGVRLANWGVYMQLKRVYV